MFTKSKTNFELIVFISLNHRCIVIHDLEFHWQLLFMLLTEGGLNSLSFGRAMKQKTCTYVRTYVDVHVDLDIYTVIES